MPVHRRPGAYPPAVAARPVLRFDAVGLVLGGTVVLDGVDWEVVTGQRWVVLGPNGSGKTSLALVASAWQQPSTGTVEVLGHRLGRVDVRRLRQRVALATPALARLLRPDLRAVDAVLTGARAALAPWWHTYGDDEREQARTLLADAGLAAAADRPVGALSEGERQQVLLARALMQAPDLVVLDEPAAALDLGARERLLARLAALAADPRTPPIVMVTHRVEEIPAAFTHALLLRGGRVAASGPVADVVAAGPLSACFGLALDVGHEGGRYTARAAIPRGG